MKRVRLPGTVLEVSRLGFGTGSLHHLPRSRDRARLLAAALDCGLTHFDTARMYGEGMAERSLGEFLAGGLRSNVTLATKVGFAIDRIGELVPAAMYLKRAAGGLARRVGIGGPPAQPRAMSLSDVQASFERSLGSLRTDWVDILFIHEPTVAEIDAVRIVAEWLRTQKSDGRARWVGLSGKASECAALAKLMPGAFDILQVEDSLAAREADAVTDAGLPLQITYGYLRNAGRSAAADAGSVLASALERNASGMVLVSTRKAERIRALARL